MEYSYFIVESAKTTQTLNTSFGTISIKIFSTSLGMLFKYADYPLVPITICEDLYVGTNCPYVFSVIDPEGIEYVDADTINEMQIGVAKR